MKTGRIFFGLAVLAVAVLALPALADGGACATAGAAPALDFDNLQVVAEQPAPEQPQVTEADLFQGAEEKQILGGGDCNETTCGAGEFCCNYSCSICAPQGGYCTQQICPPTS